MIPYTTREELYRAVYDAIVALPSKELAGGTLVSRRTGRMCAIGALYVQHFGPEYITTVEALDRLCVGDARVAAPDVLNANDNVLLNEQGHARWARMKAWLETQLGLTPVEPPKEEQTCEILAEPCTSLPEPLLGSALPAEVLPH